jgi:hypothetical protein
MMVSEPSPLTVDLSRSQTLEHLQKSSSDDVRRWACAFTYEFGLLCQTPCFGSILYPDWASGKVRLC